MLEVSYKDGLQDATKYADTPPREPKKTLIALLNMAISPQSQGENMANRELNKFSNIITKSDTNINSILI